MSEAAVPGWRRLQRRAIDYLWDNPTAEHDARAILSAPKLGIWLGLEIILIMLCTFLMGVVVPEEERDFRRALVSMGTGPYLISVTLGTVAAFVTWIVPLRASGLLEGPRWRGYLDQLVTTGVTPVRYFAGKWATSQPFFLALLGASLPFVTLFGLLGGASLGYTAVAYLLLYGYCNLLLLVSFGLGSLYHEVLAVLISWVLFHALAILEFTPTPSVLAAWTPFRYLVQPFVEVMAGSDAQVAGQLYGGAELFGATVPWPVWACGLWTLAGLLAVVTCALGPLHRFVPGLNNFGTVVLAGDARRMFFRRIRPWLTRRVDLAFLFENRGPRLGNWTLPLRALQQLAVLGLLAVMGYALLFHPVLIAELRQLQGVVICEGFVAGVVLWVVVAALVTGRTDSLQAFRVGPIRVPLLAFDLAVFFAAAAVLIGLHLTAYATRWGDLAALAARPRNYYPSNWVKTPEEAFALGSSTLAVLIATAFSALLFTKVVGARILSRAIVLFLCQVYLFGLIVLPLLAGELSRELARADGPERAMARSLAPGAFVLAQTSPATQLMVVHDGVPRWVPARGFLVERGFWFWHPLWIGLLSVLVLSRQLTVWREAAAYERRRLPASPDPPCPRCHSRLSIPAGWTWWGGLFGARLLGFLKCVECQAEFQRGSGTSNTGVVLVTALIRTLVLGLAGLLGLWALFAAVAP